jgi:RNA polymerase sigma factor (sigma-70 family)
MTMRRSSSFVQRHQHAAWAFLRSQTGSYEMTEELLQRVFATAYFQLEKLKDPKVFCGFLFGIARNLLSEQRRQSMKPNRSGRALPLDQLEHPNALEKNTSSRVAERGERARIVSAALKELDQISCTVLNLRLLEDLSYKEIAAALGGIMVVLILAKFVHNPTIFVTRFSGEAVQNADCHLFLKDDTGKTLDHLRIKSDLCGLGIADWTLAGSFQLGPTGERRLFLEVEAQDKTGQIAATWLRRAS